MCVCVCGGGGGGGGWDTLIQLYIHVVTQAQTTHIDLLDEWKDPVNMSNRE